MAILSGFMVVGLILACLMVSRTNYAYHGLRRKIKAGAGDTTDLAIMKYMFGTVLISVIVAFICGVSVVMQLVVLFTQ